MEEKYKVCFCETEVLLDLVENDRVSYYSFNLLGERKLNYQVAKCIYDEIKKEGLAVDTLMTVEAKAIGLSEELSGLLGIDRYIVVRKTIKGYMKEPVVVSENTFISGNCNYVIDKNDLDYLNGKDVLVVDDVISTGGTISALLKILSFARPKSIAIACALTEGEERNSFNGIPLISCDHIPVEPHKQEK